MTKQWTLKEIQQQVSGLSNRQVVSVWNIRMWDRHTLLVSDAMTIRRNRLLYKALKDALKKRGIPFAEGKMLKRGGA